MLHVIILLLLAVGGGRPNPGTPKDKRLAANKPKVATAKPATPKKVGK
ncbi:MAG: hypothetical protein ACR2H5_23890 [Ktedonobacteraceae bacterium]